MDWFANVVTSVVMAATMELMVENRTKMAVDLEAVVASSPKDVVESALKAVEVTDF